MTKAIKKTLGNIIGWIIGAFFIIVGFGLLLGGRAIMGIIIIICSALLVPTIKKILLDNLHIKLSKGIKVILVMIIFFTIFIGALQEGTKDIAAQETTKTSGSDEAKSAQPKEEPKEKLYSMDEDINVDYLTYRVTNVQIFNEMGTSFMKKEADGRFVKVYLEITNKAKETKQIFTPRFTLVDDQGREYDRMADDMLYISDYIEFGKQVQPSVTTKGAVVFEIAKDAKKLGLIIRGDWLSVSQVVVIITQMENIGKDTTLRDKQDDMMDEMMGDAEEQMQDIMGQIG